MSENGWVKGPWRFAEVWRPPVGNFKIDDERKDANGNIFWGYSVTGSGDHGEHILPTLAAVHNFPNNMLANARLIAAAPTMAEYIGKRASDGDVEASKIWEAINASS